MIWEKQRLCPGTYRLDHVSLKTLRGLADLLKIWRGTRRMCCHTGLRQQEHWAEQHESSVSFTVSDQKTNRNQESKTMSVYVFETTLYFSVKFYRKLIKRGKNVSLLMFL